MKKHNTFPLNSTLGLASHIRFVLEFLFILSLIPLLIMGLYNHPVGDDFTYGLQTHLTWQNTHSLLAVLKAAISTSHDFWFGYQGPYVSAFFMALHPGIISERLYALTTVIMLGALIFSTTVLLKIIFMDYYKVNVEFFRIINICLLFLCIQLLPTPSEAFYWYCGAVHYIFMHSCMLLLFACMLHWLQLKAGYRKFIFFLLSCLLAFMVGGANFVTGLLTLVLFVCAAVFCLYYKKKSALPLLLPFFFYLVSFFFCITAPGNSVRESDIGYTPNALTAIYDSFQYAITYIGQWNNLYFFLALIFLIPVLWFAASRTTAEFPLPGLIACVSFCVVSSMFAPCAYALGTSVIYGRTLNIIMMTYYLLFILNLFYLFGWINRKLKAYNASFFLSVCDFFTDMKNRYHRAFLIGIAFSMVFTICFTYHQNLTTKSAIHDLQKGYAQSYHKEVLHRIALLTTPDAKEIWVPNYSVRPYLLDLEDISEDPSNWRNQATAAWYQKSGVHLSNVYQ